MSDTEPALNADDVRPNAHTVILEIDRGYDGWRVTCGFDAGDESRPCWPHTEYGERYKSEDGKRAGCVYSDWMAEGGVENLADVRVRFDLGRATWMGDYFEFALGEHIDGSVVPSSEESHDAR